MLILLCNDSPRHFILHIAFQFVKEHKRPMGHIAHLRKQLKSINTYNYIHKFDERLIITTPDFFIYERKNVLKIIRVDFFVQNATHIKF